MKRSKDEQRLFRLIAGQRYLEAWRFCRERFPDNHRTINHCKKRIEEDKSMMKKVTKEEKKVLRRTARGTFAPKDAPITVGGTLKRGRKKGGVSGQSLAYAQFDSGNFDLEDVRNRISDELGAAPGANTLVVYKSMWKKARS